jgi:hemolysin-activating ACP:hemolysin acyltransferase
MQMNSCYDEVKTEARATWLNEEYINTIMDDISGNRIINLSFVTRLGSSYVLIHDLKRKPFLLARFSFFVSL